MCYFDRLQGDLLRNMLKKLDQQALFGMIASVCRDWRKAYPAACSSIRANIKDFKSGEQLAVWLDTHKEDLQGALEELSASFCECINGDLADRISCKIFTSIIAAGPQLRSLEVDVNFWAILSGEDVPLVLFVLSCIMHLPRI